MLCVSLAGTEAANMLSFLNILEVGASHEEGLLCSSSGVLLLMLARGIVLCNADPMKGKLLLSLSLAGTTRNKLR